MLELESWFLSLKCSGKCQFLSVFISYTRKTHWDKMVSNMRVFFCAKPNVCHQKRKPKQSTHCMFFIKQTTWADLLDLDPFMAHDSFGTVNNHWTTIVTFCVPLNVVASFAIDITYIWMFLINPLRRFSCFHTL